MLARVSIFSGKQIVVAICFYEKVLMLKVTCVEMTSLTLRHSKPFFYYSYDYINWFLATGGQYNKLSNIVSLQSYGY